MNDFFMKGSGGTDDAVYMPELQRALLNSIQDLVFVMKTEDGSMFQYIYMNEKAMAHAGLDESSYGNQLQHVLAPEAAAGLQDMYALTVKKGEVQVICDFVTEPNGKIEHYESILNPIRGANDATYVVCITRNVTDWIQKQEELLDSQMRYLSLVKYNSDAILSLDLEGRIIDVNPAAVDMFGYEREEAVGRLFADFLHPQYESEFQRIFQNALQGESLSLNAHECERRDGQKMYIDIKMIPIVVRNENKGVYLVARDVTRQLLNELRTEYLAYYDQLTGLRNRISLSEQFHAFAADAKKFGVLIINLNEFRTINEVFGHEAGDDVLKEAAERAKRVVSGQGELFRRHGNQFVLLSEWYGLGDLQRIAARILDVMQKPFSIRGEEVQMKVSIGIACSPKDGSDEETLMKRADMALEQARETGSGHYRFYEQQLDEQREQLFMLEAQLSRAMERHEFTLYYQPQVRIDTGEVIGWEALLRWRNRELGNISPARFIPLAEKTGYILQIDEWVMLEACRQLRNWLDRGFSPAPVSVNISASQFRSSRIVDLAQRALQTYNIPPRLLALEITEGALIREKQAEAILMKLRELGIAIHLDDFGTGYSSLSYLKRFPIDIIKIDRSFISEVVADERDAKITTAIIHLARTLGLKVIAEGVENAQQIQFLKQEMAWYAQGYYFDKPLPVSEVERVYLQAKQKK